MMEDTHKGESPSKKHARLLSWVDAMKCLNVKTASPGLHLILANKAGRGDISVLYGLSVPPKAIIAVGETEDDAFAAHEEYPDVSVACSDVLSIVREHRRKLSTATFTFYDRLTDDIVDMLIQTVQQGLKDDAVLNLSMRLYPAELLSSERLSPNTVYIDEIRDIELMAYYERLAHETQKLEKNRFDLQTNRVCFIGYKLARALAPFRVAICPFAAQRYVVGDDHFITVLFSTRRFNKAMPEMKFWDKYSAYASERAFHHGDLSEVSEEDIAVSINRLESTAPSDFSKRCVALLYYLSKDATDALKKKYIVEVKV